MQGRNRMTKREEDKELKQYEAMIRKISSEYNLKYNNKYDIEDLQQAARLGVLAAIRNYDPKFSTKKITHYYNYAKFYISHQIRADTGIIHIPEPALSRDCASVASRGCPPSITEKDGDWPVKDFLFTCVSTPITITSPFGFTVRDRTELCHTQTA